MIQPNLKKKNTISATDVSRNNSREDKLRFMLESAKILSTKVDRKSVV